MDNAFVRQVASLRNRTWYTYGDVTFKNVMEILGAEGTWHPRLAAAVVHSYQEIRGSWATDDCEDSD